ncbi:phosphatase PAP2 family protein [Allokutzneria albata]|uniref:PAP2 superfamily protein n=1 Tax=Allokutzneria albata TaxID=211114 RepID=A0A1G9Y3L7_ALLAB|nr:phosphatase PAP2 family protein [Allokutzneria albata]SDN03073.1 PAP2 superfamily protein [Allokutzneria albata]
MTTDSPTVARKVAKAVTEVLSPYVVLAVLAFAVGAWPHPERPAALWWAAALTLGSCVIPYVFVVNGARRGRWDGHHVNDRAGRLVPLVIITASIVVVTVAMGVTRAPAHVFALGLGEVVLIVVLGLITVLGRWKVSVHAAVGAAALVIVSILYGLDWLALAPVVMLLCWSRVELEDHTPAQVLVGTVLGVAFPAVLYPLML